MLLRVTPLLAAKELLLDLQRDSIQPFLGPVRPILVIAQRALEFSDPVFSRPQLRRQLMGHLKSLLVLGLGSSG